SDPAKSPQLGKAGPGTEGPQSTGAGVGERSGSGKTRLVARPRRSGKGSDALAHRPGQASTGSGRLAAGMRRFRRPSLVHRLQIPGSVRGPQRTGTGPLQSQVLSPFFEDL